MSPIIDAFLDRIGRRLRAAWAVSTASLLAPAVALIALLLILISRWRPWLWPERAALVLPVAVLAALVLRSLTLPLSRLQLARAADRGLDTKDAFAAVVEFRGSGQPLSPEIEQWAAGIARGAQAGSAVPIHLRARPWLAAGCIGVLAIVAAVVHNPQDDARARRAIERARIEQVAEQLRTDALAVRAANPDAAGEQMAQRLEELARELDRTDDLDAADRALTREQAELAALADPNTLAERSAVRGLDRALDAQPLPATAGGDARSQLEQLAANLPRLSESDKQSLAERLDRLAATQSVGNRDAAAALGDAARSLRSGDVASAQAALGEAAGAQAQGGANQRAEASRAASQAATTRARDALANGQGQGQGQGQGGQGQGQGGQGQGQGQGGQGGQGGGAQGQVGGVRSAGAQGGQGGAGTPNGAGNGDIAPEKDPPVYAPQTGSNGETISVDPNPTGGNAETTGKGNTATNRGSNRVPVSQALPAYQEAITRALNNPQIPPSLRAQIKAYFDSLNGGNGGNG